MAPWLVLAVHLLADLAVWALPLYFVGWMALLFQALPLAQVSLLGWWAALSTRRFYLRFTAAAAGTGFAWLVLVQGLPGLSVSSQ